MKLQWGHVYVERLYVYSLFFIVLNLPFQLKQIPITPVIGTLMLSWLLSSSPKEKWQQLSTHRMSWIFFALFALVLIGLSYTTNIQEGIKDTVLKLPLLLFPLAFVSAFSIDEKRRWQLLLAFAYSCTLSALLCLLVAFARFSNDGDIHHFFYNNFVFYKRVPIHYYALYICFSFFILLIYLIRQFKTMRKGKRLLFAFHLIFLAVVIVLISARAQILAFACTFSVFILFYFHKKGRLLRGSIVLGGFLLLFVATILLVPSSKRRVRETMDELISIEKKINNKQTNHRVFLWKYGLGVVKENFWIGSGTGSANDLLGLKLKTCKAKFWNGRRTYTLGEKTYNYHNEYLQHAATHGIVGFLLLMGLFILPLFVPAWRGNPLLLAFLSLTFISFFTESMLERQAGVFFFAFMYSLVVLSTRKRIPGKPS